MTDTGKKNYIWIFIFAAFLAVYGCFLGDASNAFSGLKEVLSNTALLITDYIYVAGPAPAFMNAALVTVSTGLLMYWNGFEVDSAAYFMVGLMAGFAFFGKNIFNMWVIVLGTFIYSRLNKTPLKTHLLPSLMAAAIGPIINNIIFREGGSTPGRWALACAVGIGIGLLIPFVSDNVGKILPNYTLYKTGFTLGIVALVVVSVLKSYGILFEPVSLWGAEYSFALSLMTICLCAFFIIAGMALGGKKDFGKLLKEPGTPPNDFVQTHGHGAVLINVGIVGLISLVYILLIGGHVNGATLGGIFTVMGFGAKGKTPKNIIPIFIGVAIAGLTSTWNLAGPGPQLAALFGTCLAPMAGAYGVIPGIITGFFHASIVMNAGAGYSGANLYNNGFSSGISVIALQPIFARLCRERFYEDPDEKNMSEAEIIAEEEERIAETIKESEEGPI